MTTHDLPTPCLLVERGRLEANIARMAGHAREHRVRLRPHVKTHKCLSIARMQLDAGASGLTVATPWEAEVFAAVSSDLFLARSLADGPGIARVVRLARRGIGLLVAVDSLDAAEALAREAAAAGVEIGVRVEVDTGQRRCGVPPDDCVAFARAVAEMDGLVLEGLFTHEGHTYQLPNVPEREAEARRVAHALCSCAAELRAAGHALPSVSVGSTPARLAMAGLAGVTELRPGNYVFHDETQVRLGAASLDDCAATVLATVVSLPRPGVVVLDAGRKALSTDGLTAGSMGIVLEAPTARFVGASEEHGMVEWPQDAELPTIGARVRVVPYHSCPVTNLFDEIVLVEGDAVLAVWPVEARGYGPVRP